MTQEVVQLNFPIIDPHIHQWDPYHTPHAAQHLVKVLGNYPRVMDRLMRLVKPKPLIDSLGLTDHALAPYLPRNYKQDIGHFNVESVVHVEANWHDHKGTGVVGETLWIDQLPFNEQNIMLGAIVATADPRKRDFKKILQLHHEASPHFRGIRKMASFHEDKGIYRWCDQAGLYRDKKFLQGFEQIVRQNLTFDAWCYSTQLDDVTALAKHFPEAKIMLDHLGTPAGLFGAVGKSTGITVQARQTIFEEWKVKLATLAECPNVHAKISGLLMPVLGHDFHLKKQKATKMQIIERLQPMINHAVQVFGADRILFASNFPMDKPSADLTKIIAAYIEMIQPYGEDAMFKIFHQNAKNFYQIG